MIDLSGISLQFGGKYLFKDVNCKINSGERIALVGANGSGKSSLLKIIVGELQPESGKILKQKHTTVGYLPQDNVTHKGHTLLEESLTALSDITWLQEKEKEITDSLADTSITDEEQEELVNRLGEVHLRLQELGSYSASSNVEKILTGLGFEENDFHRLTEEFSGGWQMRIALAKLLIAQNDLLLLDEPTNHLDIDSLEWLISFLKAYKGALIVVSHDKHFVTQVTSKTYELFNRKFSIFNGDYNSYLKFKDERDEQLIHKHELQQKQIKETKRFIERFRYKNTKAKQVQSRVKQLEKLELVELPESESKISINFPEPPKSGRMNIALKSIKKSYGNNVVLDGLDFSVQRGDKIAFVGRNGAGKSTLAKIIAGSIDFDSGERIVGHNTIISYYAQDVADELEPDKDIIETVENISEEKTLGQLRTLLGAFLFRGDDVFKKVRVLSGGEKSRVALTKILLTKSNLIILDEPTNHLDILSKKVLQQALINFKGSLILVSHDVDFLEPIVNKVIEMKKGKLKIYEGGIDYYLYKKRVNAGNEVQNEQKRESINKRKEQKRIEAEKRQAKYKATKELTDKISALEKEIEILEANEKELEDTLADPATYQDISKANELNNEFNFVKGKLSLLLQQWEKLTEELMKVEAQFD